MLVIIEGNEGAGKTTLIKELGQHLQFVTVKYPKGPLSVADMLFYFADHENLFVLDRGFVSDMVYRIRDKEFGQMTLSEIDRLCNRDVKLIFCYNDNGFKDAVNRGEDNLRDEDDYNQLEDSFWKIRTLLECFTNVKTKAYNFRYQDVTEIVKFITEEI